MSSHNKPVISVAISNNGKFVVSGSSDCTLKMWDLETGELIHTLNGHL